MPKTRTTLTIDEEVLRSARMVAASRGMKEGELIEEALRDYLGIGAFREIWDRIEREGLPTDDGVDLEAMSDDELMDWVVEQQHLARTERRGAAAGSR